MTIASRPEDEGGFVCLNPYGEREAGPFKERAEAEAYRQRVYAQLQALQRHHTPRYRG